MYIYIHLIKKRSFGIKMWKCWKVFYSQFLTHDFSFLYLFESVQLFCGIKISKMEFIGNLLKNLSKLILYFWGGNSFSLKLWRFVLLIVMKWKLLKVSSQILHCKIANYVMEEYCDTAIYNKLCMLLSREGIFS